MTRDEDMSNVVLPTVHLNGTSSKELCQLREDAYLAINAALDAMRQMAPNGRDYYPVPGSMERAQEQHRRRCLALQRVADEISYEAVEIQKLGRR